MAYVAKFKWDVFVSYARVDDEPPPGERGWVSIFKDELRRKVRYYLGEDFEMYFDRKKAGAGNHLLEEMTAAAANSAIFVAIASPTYVKREWTKKEIAAFDRVCDDPHRLFVAELLPRDPCEKYPDLLERKIFAEFWRRLTDSEAIDPLPPNSEGFNKNMTDFSFKLQKQLRLMRERYDPPPPEPEPPASDPAGCGSADGPTIEAPLIHVIIPEAPPAATAPIAVSTSIAAPPPPAAAVPARTVLIARAGDDVADVVDDVRRHLSQYPEVVQVLPQGAYSQDEAEFKAAFLADLAGSDFLVQILGASPDRPSDEIPEGYVRFQREAARAADKTILQWRHPALELDKVEDAAYRALLADPQVIVLGLEQFKGKIVSDARKPPDEGTHFNPAKVFVNADRQNILTAKGIAAEFAAQKFEPELPRFDGTVSENRSYLNKMMTECGVVVVVNGVQPPIWWDTQRNLFDMLRPSRKATAEGLAVCTVPPADHLEPELIGDEFEHIDCSDGWDVGRVREYVRGLKQRLGPQPRLDA